jgi:hypothetical protein
LRHAVERVIVMRLRGESLTRDSGLLGLYWPARRECLEECALRVYETLRVLQILGYKHYYFLGRSRRDALKRPLDVTEQNVLATLAKGVNHADIPPHFISDPEQNGTRQRYYIDLGTAPVEAFEELLDACIRGGAMEVIVGSAQP